MLTNIAICINSIAGYPFQNISENYAACAVQAFLVYYGYLSWNMWVLILSINNYIIIGLGRIIKRALLAEIIYIIVCWGLPLIPTVIYISLGWVVASDLWCGVSNGNRQFGLLAFWIPQLVLVTLSAIFFGLTIHKLRKATANSTDSLWKSAINRGAIFMLIFLSLYITLNVSRALMRIINLGRGISGLSFAEQIVYTIFTTTTGILYLVVFGTSKEHYIGLKKLCQKSETHSTATAE
jgi:hypothetical protein